LWTRWVGDPPLECLAKFGYRSDGEVKTYGIPPLIWRLVETYSLNLATLFIYFLTPNVLTWAPFLLPFVPVTPFFSGQVVKHLSKKIKIKIKIAYYLCLTQNNSQKALQRDKGEQEKKGEQLIACECAG
jgi:hypothetical protein